MSARSRVFIFPSVNVAEDSPSISFDVVKDISPSFTKTITKTPVSNGTMITDHVVQNNPTLTIEGYVSNSPLILSPNNIIDQRNPESRAQAAYLVLKDLYEKSNLNTVVFRYDTFNDYILSSFEPIILPSESIGFRLTFEHIRFATEERVNLVQNLTPERAIDANRSNNSGSGQKEEASGFEATEFYGLIVDTGQAFSFSDDLVEEQVEQNNQQ